MSKKKNKLKLEEKVMSLVKDEKISMKPKWYFVMGSSLFFGGLVSLGIGISFLVNLTAFVMRKHGPLASWRLQLIIDNFPWWAPMLAATGFILGVKLLKKYDFSYKKNFGAIVISSILAILAAGLLIDKLGLNDYWARRGPMKRFYQGFEPRGEFRKPQKRFERKPLIMLEY
jgi:hypothetical protein